MRRLLTVAVLGALLSGMSGCRFFECLFRGGPCAGQQQAAPVVACPPPCVTSSDPCVGAPAVTMPGPETYAPTR